MMKIFNTDSLEDIQNRFTNLYPFLRLKFYKKTHGIHSASSVADVISSTCLVVDINRQFEEVNLELSDEMSVAELENMFVDCCRLNVQVFRKSGDAWLQTSSTDDWSLVKHMNTAEMAQDYNLNN